MLFPSSPQHQLLGTPSDSPSSRHQTPHLYGQYGSRVFILVQLNNCVVVSVLQMGHSGDGSSSILFKYVVVVVCHDQVRCQIIQSP